MLGSEPVGDVRAVIVSVRDVLDGLFEIQVAHFGEDVWLVVVEVNAVEYVFGVDQVEVIGESGQEYGAFVSAVNEDYVFGGGKSAGGEIIILDAEVKAGVIGVNGSFDGVTVHYIDSVGGIFGGEVAVHVVEIQGVGREFVVRDVGFLFGEVDCLGCANSLIAIVVVDVAEEVAWGEGGGVAAD